MCAIILACRPVHHTHMRERGHHEQAGDECEPALDLLRHRLGERMEEGRRGDTASHPRGQELVYNMFGYDKVPCNVHCTL